MALPKITGSTVIKLLIACLIVGFALTFFDVDPKNLLISVGGLIRDLAQWSVSVFGKWVSYILLGAVIVLPIWLFFYLLRAARGRR
jgi:hypothetical protein